MLGDIAKGMGGGAVMGPIGGIAGSGFAGDIVPGLDGVRGIGDPNIKSRDAQRKADELREAIINRRKTLENMPGYSGLPQAKTFEASQLNLPGETRFQALNMAEQLARNDIPSTAMTQHRLATDRGLKQAMALGASRRDPGAFRQALEAQAGIQSQAALQSGLVRSQEAQRQQNALAQAAGITSGIRGQDIGIASANQAAEMKARQFGADAANNQAVRNEQLRQQFEAERQRQIGRTFDQQMGPVNTSAGIAKAQEGTQERRTKSIFDAIGDGISGGISSGLFK